jgi:hypothetical protein
MSSREAIKTALTTRPPQSSMILRAQMCPVRAVTRTAVAAISG